MPGFPSTPERKLSFVRYQVGAWLGGHMEPGAYITASIPYLLNPWPSKFSRNMSRSLAAATS